MKYVGLVLLAILTMLALSHDERYFAAQMNSDTLWQAHYLWDLGHVQGALQNFQVAEVGNQIPDLILGWVLTHVFPSWRQVVFAIMLAHFLLYTFSGAAVVVEMVRTSFARAALGTAGVLAAIVMLDVLLPDVTAPASWVAGLLHYPELFPVSTLFIVGAHSGAYPLGLFAVAITARHFHDGRSPMWPLCVFALIGSSVFSDRQVTLEIAAPLVVVVAVFGLLRVLRHGWRAGAGPALYIAAAAAGSEVALVALHMVHAIQDPLLPSAADAIRRVPGVLEVLLGFARAHPNLTVAPLLLSVVFLAAPYAFVRWPAATPEERERRWFLWIFALLAFLLISAFFVALYVDLDAMRYIEPSLFVIVSFFVALALQTKRFANVPIAIGAVAALSAVVALVRVDSVLPRQLVWRSTYASCIANLHARYGIEAGLGGYWTARPETLSSDFTVQVDPVRPDGSELGYMNDATWFQHSISDPSRPPRYRFIIVHGLDENALMTRFGQPDHTFDCKGEPILVYDDPTRLQRLISKAH